MPVPGRICPRSGSPAVECAATCCAGECYAFSPPDSLFAEKLGFWGKPLAYAPPQMPPSFEAASSFDMVVATRNRLFSITPETEHGTAVRYLKDASLMLFMGRALQGILKSGSKDLIPCYEGVLRGKVDEDRTARLEEIISDLRKALPEKGSAEVQAQRMKGVFSLHMASKLRECT
ncbi:MAG: hypothetical protein FJZ49_00925 [Candidatus Verstraetearchaeota archaeon]|nr:hypothetical protein [Candidatus Verstraetearchaeota archaeon]